MPYLSIDIESYSEADLKDVGLSKYARDPSTEIMMCAYAFDGEEPEIWVPNEGEPMPNRLRSGLLDPAYTKRAWNMQFERTLFKHVLDLDIPIEQCRCVMVLAHSLALPPSLGQCGPVVDLPSDKQKDSRGKALIRMFCMPRKPTKTKAHTRNTREHEPEAWEEFKRYCKQDVVTEREIWRRIRKWDMPEHEWKLWRLDQEINDAGIPINPKRVKNALAVVDRILEDRIERMKEITGLHNPNSGAQLLPWLQDRGYPYNDLKKGHVSAALAMQNDPDGDVAQVLEMRQEISKSSTKKYAAVDAALDDDGRLRYTLQFAGAGRTWRWAGRRYQPQNLPRPMGYLENTQVEAATYLSDLDAETFDLFYEKPMDVLSTCLRPIVEAPEGYVFVDADLNAIENRVLGWLCDEQKILDVFLNKRDPYVDFAQYMFDRPYAELYHEYKVLKNKKPRTLAKPAVLGAGYRLGAGYQYEDEATGEVMATGLLGYAWNMGVKMTPEEAAHAVKVWRETYPNVVEYWYEIENAAKHTVSTGKKTKARKVFFELDGPFLKMGLPSGRFLHYCRPTIEMVKTPWGEDKMTLTYEQLNDKNQWVRVPTQGGKLLENADQAVSRDLLANGLTLARKRGINIVLHIHDQIVGLVKEANGDKALKILIECMCTPPSWAPDMPLGAEGAVNKLFVKD